MNALRPVSVYDTLRQQIIRFTLLPGEYLSENGLAASLHVSRTPVREALSRLEEENCVEVFPQRGTQVSLISLDRIRQAVFFRATLEQDVAQQLCVQGLTQEQFDLLESSLAAQRDYYRRQDPPALLTEDTHMHQLLYRFCGKESVWDAFTAINCDLMRIRYLQILTYSYKTSMAAVDSWENKLTEHRMILNALKKRDTEAAMLLSRSHIEQIERSAETLQRIYPQYFQE